MFEAFGEDAEGEGLGLGDGVVGGWAVNHYAWDFDDFGYPAAVGFLFGLYGEGQGHICVSFLDLEGGEA